MAESTKGILKVLATVTTVAANVGAIVAYLLNQPLVAGILFAGGGAFLIIALALYSDTIPRQARLAMVVVGLGLFALGVYIVIRILLLDMQRVPPSKTVVLLPTTAPIALSPALFGCPVQGAGGTIIKEGGLDLTGLKPSQTYYLTLNGYPGKPPIPPNDELKKCSSTGDEGYCDFMSVKTGSDGSVRNVKLEAAFPPGVTLRPNETYRTKFFVKDPDAGYCIVLYNDNFLFTVR